MRSRIRQVKNVVFAGQNGAIGETTVLANATTPCCMSRSIGPRPHTWAGATSGGGRMPGGHLTYEDRRKIAEGLVEGLTYAEIARRLGRPRSTIGREIARNGGPHGYHAARAQ